ncbi:hypothetical protein [Desulfurobacterium crinifex]
MVELPKNAMRALKPEQRELIKEYKGWLLRNGYKEGSAQTLGRKAARYLYLCEQEGLDPADEVSLLKVKKISHDLAIRAKKFAEFLQERKREQLSLAGKEEASVQPTVVEGTQPEQNVMDEVVKKLNSLESLLREALASQSKGIVSRGEGFNLEMLIGKPVTVRTVDNKLYSGELLGYDEDMIYVLSVENRTEEKRFHSGGKRTPYVKRVPQEPQSFVYSISRQVVESLETPASFFDFGSEPER